MRREIFDLPWPTSQTIIGPKFYLDSQTLTLDYDFELDDGSVEWTRVVFQDVLALEYRQDICCQAEDMDAYNKVVKYLDSDWLEEMSNRWVRVLGRQADKEQTTSYAHWRIYFDDAGCIDVIAQSIEID